LQQVFTNLISNAVKYNDKVKLNITYNSLTDFHEFTISKIMDPELRRHQQKVFQVFQTIEARDVRKYRNWFVNSKKNSRREKVVWYTSRVKKEGM
jgi:signal transduction histidine kinase